MNKEKHESLESSFVSTLKSDSAFEIAKESAEITIDAFLDEGILRHIPIVGFLTNLTKSGISIRERLFVEKVIKFLTPLSNYTREERSSFFEKLDESELKKASQSIVLYLERLDSLDKPQMLGKIFTAYMKGEITYKAMMYFSHFVDDVFIMVWNDYMEAIEDAKKKYIFSPDIHLDDALALEKVGFYAERLEHEKEFDSDLGKEFIVSSKRVLELTQAGWQFTQLVFAVPAKRLNYSNRHSFDVTIENT